MTSMTSVGLAKPLRLRPTATVRISTWHRLAAAADPVQGAGTADVDLRASLCSAVSCWLSAPLPSASREQSRRPSQQPQLRPQLAPSAVPRTSPLSRSPKHPTAAVAPTAVGPSAESRRIAGAESQAPEGPVRHPELKVSTPAYTKHPGWHVEFEFRVRTSSSSSAQMTSSVVLNSCW